MSYLNELNPQQKEAAEHLHGPIMIIAGAGAGKTKTITHRIAHLIENGVPGEAILAVTFTNKAAGEMRERVGKLLENTTAGNSPISAINDRAGLPRRRVPFISTFHSLGVRILREYATEIGLPRSFSIWDRDDSVRAVKEALKELGLDRDHNPRQLLSVISKQKGDGVKVDEYYEKVRFPWERTAATVWRMYEKSLKSEHALDFDDLLIRTLNLLQSNPNVLRALRERWTHITIDEYQDTNRSQYEIARLLAGEKKNLCVVGDIDQNIYSWRGADISHLLSFEENFPGARRVTLEENYRSTRTILAAANAIIEKNVRRQKKNLFTNGETGDPIVVHAAYSEADEAMFIAEETAQRIRRGVKPLDIAILYRENFQSRALEEAFFTAGLPYRVLGVRFFERKEVKDLLSYLRLALNPNSRADLARTISTPSRGIGQATLARILSNEEDKLSPATRAKVAAFRQKIENIRAAIETRSASDSVRFALQESGLESAFKDGGEEGRDRLENARELVAFSTRYDSLPAPEGVERILEDAALASEQDSLEKKTDTVTLMTVHASKGLEFDTVFVTGLEQGLFPSERASDDRDPEEERRLFYVAVTRAKRKLYLTHAGTRLKYGTREYTLPSEFLSDIRPELLQNSTTRGNNYEEKTIY